MKMKKTKKANLENKRTMFFQIGFVVSLALVLLAFEWTTVRSNEKLVILDDGLKMDNEYHKVEWKKEKIKMPKVNIPKKIEIVDDETDVDDENLEIQIEVDINSVNGDPIDFGDDTEETEEPMIFTIAEQMPEFPGGLAAMLAFLKDNIKYPSVARDAGIQGTVYIQFIVNEEGKIVDPFINRGIGGGCDEEALRVVKLMPHWSPGVQRTQKVKVQMVLPVSYKLNY
jgi:protein TonB